MADGGHSEAELDIPRGDTAASAWLLCRQSWIIGMYGVRPSALLWTLTLMLSCTFSVPTSGTISKLWCPTPDPCHCVSSEVVYCAFARLDSIPYFMNFDRTYNELDLSQNFLAALPAAGLRGIRVTKLTLSWNAIKTIHNRAFVGVQAVTEVDLSHNYLSQLPSAVFAPVTDLATLKLCYNRLSQIAYGTFQGLPRLTELDLSGNDLHVVPTEALSQLGGLQKLVLRNTKLRHIDAYAFNNLPLLSLDLGENGKPLELPPEAFCGLEPHMVHSEPGVIDWLGVKTLLLDHNGMSTLHPCISQILWTLNNVDLSGNPLHCDCMLFLLRDMGSRAKYIGAQCAAPLDIGGRYLEQISSQSYDCSRNRTYLSCGSICQSHQPPPSKHGGWAGSALSGQCVIFIHPLVVMCSWGVLRLQGFH